MPVSPDSANRNIKYVAGSATSGTVNLGHAINALAQDNWAFAALYLTAKVSTAGSTIGATWGGDAMTEIARVTFDSAKNVLVLFGLQDAPAGPQTVAASVSGMTAHAGDGVTDAGGFWLILDTVSYSGALSIGTAVTVSGDSAGAATANSVTVASVAPAYRVLTVHAVRNLNVFTANNQTARADAKGGVNAFDYILTLSPIPSLLDFDMGGELLVQDAAGAATVTGTCTQPSTSKWGAIGLPVAPAPVTVEGALSITSDISAQVSIQRVATPSPQRTWVIK